MNKDNPTTEDDIREEYDLKQLKVRKLGSGRKIFDGITTIFRRPSNDSIRKAQKIENKILTRINNPGVICKVFIDEGGSVDITFEQKITGQIMVQDIHLYEALNIARKNTKENQIINVFARENSGYRHPIFLLEREMDLCNSIDETLSYLRKAKFDRKKTFNRKNIIDALRGRQAARQLVYSQKKEDLRQYKFASEKRSENLTYFLKLNSFILIIFGIIFIGYPGLLESSVLSRFFNPSVNYKTCKTIGKDGKDTNKIKDTNKTDEFCKIYQGFYSLYKLIILYFLLHELDLAYKSYQTKKDILIINYAIDMLSNDSKDSDKIQK